MDKKYAFTIDQLQALVASCITAYEIGKGCAASEMNKTIAGSDAMWKSFWNGINKQGEEE